MHPELSVWIQMYALIGHETAISQALTLLDRAGATEEDYDVFLDIRNWYNEAHEEKRKAESNKG
ncbi:hypothetical protein EP7_004339 [Isosphaeraceae bacterium EP7]